MFDSYETLVGKILKAFMQCTDTMDGQLTILISVITDMHM